MQFIQAVPFSNQIGNTLICSTTIKQNLFS